MKRLAGRMFLLGLLAWILNPTPAILAQNPTPGNMPGAQTGDVAPPLGPIQPAVPMLSTDTFTPPTTPSPSPPPLTQTTSQMQPLETAAPEALPTPSASQGAGAGSGSKLKYWIRDLAEKHTRRKATEEKLHVERTAFFRDTEKEVAFVARYLRAGGLADEEGRHILADIQPDGDELAGILAKYAETTPVPILKKVVSRGTPRGSWISLSTTGINDKRLWPDADIIIIYDKNTGKVRNAGIYAGWASQVTVRSIIDLRHEVTGIKLFDGDATWEVSPEDYPYCEAYHLHPFGELSSYEFDKKDHTILYELKQAIIKGDSMGKDSIERKRLLDWHAEQCRTNFMPLVRWASRLSDNTLYLAEEVKKEIKVYNDWIEQDISTNEASISWYEKAIIECRKRNQETKYLQDRLNELRDIVKWQKQCVTYNDSVGQDIVNAFNQNPSIYAASGEARAPIDQDNLVKFTEAIDKAMIKRIEKESELREVLEKAIDKAYAAQKNWPLAERQKIAIIEKGVLKKQVWPKYAAALAKWGPVSWDVFKKGWEGYKPETEEKIRKAAERGDVCLAWRITLEELPLEGLPPIVDEGVTISWSLLAPFVADATCDMVASYGNSMAHWMWEHGYSPWPPRYKKYQFNSGAIRPGGPYVPPPVPTPPPEPFPTPGDIGDFPPNPPPPPFPTHPPESGGVDMPTTGQAPGSGPLTPGMTSPGSPFPGGRFPSPKPPFAASPGSPSRPSDPVSPGLVNSPVSGGGGPGGSTPSTPVSSNQPPQKPGSPGKPTRPQNPGSESEMPPEPGGGSGAPNRPDCGPLEGTAWTVVKVTERFKDYPADNISATFKQSMIIGRMDGTAFSGTVSVRPPKAISISNVMTDVSGQVERNTNSVPSKFIRLLPTVRSFSLQPQTLILKDAEARPVITCAPAP